MIWTRINDPRSLGSWLIKGAHESLTRVDSSVPLMHHDPSDLLAPREMMMMMIRSEWSRITDPDPSHPKGTHPETNVKLPVTPNYFKMRLRYLYSKDNAITRKGKMKVSNKRPKEISGLYFRVIFKSVASSTQCSFSGLSPLELSFWSDPSELPWYVHESN